MIRFLLLSILIMLVARAALRVLDGVIEAAGGRPKASKPRAIATTLARDPVCGTYVAPTNAPSVRAGAATYYFCSERCLNAYQRDGASRSHAS